MNYKKILILFSILGNKAYVDLLTLQLLLFQYHQYFNHPHIHLFNEQLQSFVGEDIELGNRALSHASARNSRRGQLEDLSRCYRLLRFLRLTGVQFGEDMTEYKDIVKGSRRYDIKDETVLDGVRRFLTELLNDTYQHYVIPHKFQKKSKRIRPAESKAERKATSILILKSQNLEKATTSQQSRELMEVPFFLSL